jgi:hypothetical protein
MGLRATTASLLSWIGLHTSIEPGVESRQGCKADVASSLFSAVVTPCPDVPLGSCVQGRPLDGVPCPSVPRGLRGALHCGTRHAAVQFHEAWGPTVYVVQGCHAQAGPCAVGSGCFRPLPSWPGLVLGFGCVAFDNMHTTCCHSGD